VFTVNLENYAHITMMIPNKNGSTVGDAAEKTIGMATSALPESVKTTSPSSILHTL
jgi:hypothetical protein